MQGREYRVVSVLSALRLRSSEAYGRYRLSVIPPGATIEVHCDSETFFGMVEAVWNGNLYALFPADLTDKTHLIAA